MTQREETNAMKRCVTFVRGAVDGSVHGAEWQQAATKTFCETNQLLPVDSVVLRNLSAKSPETRAALEALMGRKVLRNDFDAIVVTDLSRLSRDANHAVQLMKSFDDIGVSILTLNGQASSEFHTVAQVTPDNSR